MTMSPFNGSGFRTDNPRKKDRQCRGGCGGMIDAASRHIICGNCHANRMARRQGEDDEPASSSQGA